MDRRLDFVSRDEFEASRRWRGGARRGDALKARLDALEGKAAPAAKPKSTSPEPIFHSFSTIPLRVLAQRADSHKMTARPTMLDESDFQREDAAPIDMIESYYAAHAGSISATTMRLSRRSRQLDRI